MESQRAAEAKAACDTALAASNRERRQEQLRAAQELVDCLGAGMDLLSVEQIKQIKEAAAAAGNEPGEALRSFGERLRDLRKENPHASEADLKEAVKSAVPDPESGPVSDSGPGLDSCPVLGPGRVRDRVRNRVLNLSFITQSNIMIRIPFFHQK